MEGEILMRSTREAQASRLEAASEQLGDVLEGLDLNRDRTFAEAVVEAVSATERARRLGVETEG